MQKTFDRVRKLVQRLDPEMRLRKTRENGWPRVNWGEFYLFNIYGNFPTETHLDLDELEKRLKGGA